MQTTIATSVPVRMAEEVDKTAHQTGMTRSRFIRRALERALKDSGGEGDTESASNE